MSENGEQATSRMKLSYSAVGCEAQSTECRPGRCGKIGTSKTIAARMTTEAKGRLRESPPLTGLRARHSNSEAQLRRVMETYIELGRQPDHFRSLYSMRGPLRDSIALN